MGTQNIAEQGANNQLFGGAASAQNAQNANNISNVNNMQSINSGIAQNNTNAVASTEGGFMNSLGKAGMMAMAAEGGMIGSKSVKFKYNNKNMHPHIAMVASIYHPNTYADGGPIYSGATTVGSSPAKLPGGVGADMSDDSTSPKKSGGGGPDMTQANAISGMDTSGGESMAGSDAGGSGSIGDLGGGMMAAKSGGTVPGKAKVKNNSYSNDVVPAMLSPGEIVLPRSVTTHMNAPQEAAKFVQAILAKKGKKKNG